MANQGIVSGAAVTSWGVSPDFVAKLLSQNGPKSWSIDATGNTFDSTRFGGVYFTTKGKSLRTVPFSIAAHLGTPLDGYNGLLTFASGYAANINSWTMEITRPLAEVTPFGQQWMRFTPGLVSWTGTFSGWSDTAIPHFGTVTGAEPATATFQVISGGSGKQLTGSIITTKGSARFEQGAPATCSYSFDGTGVLGTVGTSTAALWAAEADGVILSERTSKTLVLTDSAAQAYSGTAFWRRIGLTVTVGQPVMLAIDGVFSDTVTGLNVT